MHGDPVKRLLLEVPASANSPLETTELVSKVLETFPTTRAIIFKRLTVLRKDGDINGAYLGSGKGVWVWWRKNSFLSAVHHQGSFDAIATEINRVLWSASGPLETKEIEELVSKKLACTRALVLRRLNILRGETLRGKAVGSSKKTWIWWRENAFAR